MKNKKINFQKPEWLYSREYRELESIVEQFFRRWDNFVFLHSRTTFDGLRRYERILLNNAQQIEKRINRNLEKYKELHTG